MTFIVKQDEAFDPLDIGFFGLKVIMPGTNGLAHLIKKFWLLAATIHLVYRNHRLT
jgi:hypothetical protein